MSILAGLRVWVLSRFVAWLVSMSCVIIVILFSLVTIVLIVIHCALSSRRHASMGAVYPRLSSR